MSLIKLSKPSLVEQRHLVNHSFERAYVVYENKPHKHWWQHLLRKPYHHLYLVKFTGIFWIRMDFLLGFTDINVLPYDWHDTINDVTKDEDVKIQYMEVWRRPRYRVRTIFAPWVLTPYQLYKYCEAHNGVDVKKT